MFMSDLQLHQKLERRIPVAPLELIVLPSAEALGKKSMIIWYPSGSIMTMLRRRIPPLRAMSATITGCTRNAFASAPAKARA